MGKNNKKRTAGCEICAHFTGPFTAIWKQAFEEEHRERTRLQRVVDTLQTKLRSFTASSNGGYPQ